MFEYINNVQELITTVVKEETENIKQAIDLVTQSILDKKSIHTFGASHAGILSEEMFYRAGGLMITNPIFGRELMLDTSPITQTSKMERLVGYGTYLAENAHIKKDDVVICHSVSGRNPVTIEVAMYAKNIGAKVISITNLSYSKQVTSRHPSGKNLYQISDVVIDNHGEIGDACVKIENIQQKVGPTSTVVGACIVNTITTEVVKKLVERGMETPPIFYSANVDGGDQKNKELFKQYQDSIHYKLD